MRSGKVFIDWSQNDEAKTTVIVYSIRAMSEQPYVSLPIPWKKIETTAKKRSPDGLFFTPKAALREINKSGDLFGPVLKLRQRIPKSFLESVAEQKKETPLVGYREKRNFSRTTEPHPKVGKRKRPGDLSFVIQKHRASRLHYDLRLEMEGVLRSWAVPKGLSTIAGERRLAVHVEDHPMEYRNFEGIIPEGNYGAGTVMIWDTGTYSLKGDIDPVLAYKSGKMHFNLNGKKLKGEWALVRTNKKNHWYVIKVGADAGHISKKSDDESAVTKRTLAKIARDKSAVWE